ncbi:MAG: fluoride efflux transporter CrcB [Planctomycetota bacterium]
MEWIAIALGGMAGALLRHSLSVFFSSISPAWLPYATLTANIAGCFAIGILFQWSQMQGISSTWWIVGIRVGLLGGLTTFSSFALDLVQHWSQKGATASSLLCCLHLLVGLAAVIVGIQLGSQIAGNPPVENAS